MRLLVTTQTLDVNDPLLGFFHGWIREFSKNFDEIHVVCLKEGEHDLPQHVHVHSLGKESGESRLKYVLRFYSYTFRYRRSYDKVFSHMNPHYVILGGMFWKLWGKEIFFWRNHAKINWMTEVAARFAKHVFYTSDKACTRKYVHAIRMPVGIDMELFRYSPKAETKEKKILFLGRVSPVKRVELFVHAAHALPQTYRLHLYGDAPPQDSAYGEEMRRKARESVIFHPSIRNYETPEIYQSHDLYVNMTPEGSMDKTVLEAVACGTLVIAANGVFRDVLTESLILREQTGNALAQKIQEVLDLSPREKEVLRKHAHDTVLNKHSLARLSAELTRYIHD